MRRSLLAVFVFAVAGLTANAQGTSVNNFKTKKLYMDVHELPAGKVKFDDVAAAHLKDLAVQGQYGVQFHKFWVDENKGLVFCLSSAADTSAVVETHRHAHGLLPDKMYPVIEGIPATVKHDLPYFIDVHYLGAKKIAAADIAKAHELDLISQQSNGVHFINYWIDEASGAVFCLSQAKKASQVIKTHKQAHGYTPDYIAEVKQGQ